MIFMIELAPRWRKTKRGLENKWKKWKKSYEDLRRPYDDLRRKIAKYSKYISNPGHLITDKVLEFVKNAIKGGRKGMRKINYYWKMIRAVRGFIREVVKQRLLNFNTRLSQEVKKVKLENMPKLS